MKLLKYLLILLAFFSCTAYSKECENVSSLFNKYLTAYLNIKTNGIVINATNIELILKKEDSSALLSLLEQYNIINKDREKAISSLKRCISEYQSKSIQNTVSDFTYLVYGYNQKFVLLSQKTQSKSNPCIVENNSASAFSVIGSIVSIYDKKENVLSISSIHENDAKYAQPPFIPIYLINPYLNFVNPPNLRINCLYSNVSKDGFETIECYVPLCTKSKYSISNNFIFINSMSLSHEKAPEKQLLYACFREYSLLTENTMANVYYPIILASYSQNGNSSCKVLITIIEECKIGNITNSELEISIQSNTKIRANLVEMDL